MDPQRVRDEKLGFLFVREKVINESQLKTALDFQRAVGGTLDTVLVRLQFVDRAILDGILEKHGFSQAAPGPSAQDAASDAPPVATPARAAAGGDGDGQPPPVDLLAGVDAPSATDADDPLEPSPRPGLASSSAARQDPGDVTVAVEAHDDDGDGEDDGGPHTSIILDALLRILIRKGVIESEEIKRELRNLDPAHD